MAENPLMVMEKLDLSTEDFEMLIIAEKQGNAHF